MLLRCLRRFCEASTASFLATKTSSLCSKTLTRLSVFFLMLVLVVFFFWVDIFWFVMLEKLVFLIWNFVESLSFALRCASFLCSFFFFFFRSATFRVILFVLLFVKFYLLFLRCVCVFVSMCCM